MKPKGLKIHLFSLLLPFCLTICTIAVFYACEKKTEEKVEHYHLVSKQEYDVMLYTVDGAVDAHNYSIENVFFKDFFTSHLISEIILRNNSSASLYFPQSEFKEALDFVHSNLSVSFRGDSILFSKNLNVDDFDLSVDIRGILLQNEIQIKGVLYEYMFANTGYEGGMEYFPYSVQEIVNKYWAEEYDYCPYDTLAI